LITFKVIVFIRDRSFFSGMRRYTAIGFRIREEEQCLQGRWKKIAES
jgi:hypothetical protein